jgi:hypothetical protein
MRNGLLATGLAVMSWLALAVAPGAASAALYSGGTLLPDGSIVKGVNTGGVHFESYSASNIDCASSRFQARLDRNRVFESQLSTESWNFDNGSGGPCHTSLTGQEVYVVGSSYTCWSAGASAWKLQNCRGGQQAITVIWPNGTFCQYQIGSVLRFGAENNPVRIWHQEGTMSLIGAESASFQCAGSYTISTGVWTVQDANGNPLTWK